MTLIKYEARTIMIRILQYDPFFHIAEFLHIILPSAFPSNGNGKKT